MASERARPRSPPIIDPPGYARYRPEATLLYQIIERHYPEFATARGAAGPTPKIRAGGVRGVPEVRPPRARVPARTLRRLPRGEARCVQSQAPRFLSLLRSVADVGQCGAPRGGGVAASGCCRCRLRCGSLQGPQSAPAKHPLRAALVSPCSFHLSHATGTSPNGPPLSWLRIAGGDNSIRFAHISCREEAHPNHAAKLHARHSGTPSS